MKIRRRVRVVRWVVGIGHACDAATWQKPGDVSATVDSHSISRSNVGGYHSQGADKPEV